MEFSVLLMVGGGFSTLISFFTYDFASMFCTIKSVLEISDVKNWSEHKAIIWPQLQHLMRFTLTHQLYFFSTIYDLRKPQGMSHKLETHVWNRGSKRKVGLIIFPRWSSSAFQIIVKHTDISQIFIGFCEKCLSKPY